MNEAQVLMFMQFSEGTVVYTKEFKIVTTGTLWPRQFQAANDAIQIYKDCSKVDYVAKKKEEQMLKVKEKAAV